MMFIVIWAHFIMPSPDKKETLKNSGSFQPNMPTANHELNVLFICHLKYTPVCIIFLNQEGRCTKQNIWKKKLWGIKLKVEKMRCFECLLYYVQLRQKRKNSCIFYTILHILPLIQYFWSGKDNVQNKNIWKKKLCGTKLKVKKMRCFECLLYYVQLRQKGKIVEYKLIFSWICLRQITSYMFYFIPS